MKPDKSPPDPSKPLKNQKHELFVQGVIKGKSHTESYKTVYGCSQRTAEGNAHAVMEYHGVAARISYLQSKVTEKVVLSLEDSLKYLTDAILTSPDKIDASSILCQDYSVSESGVVKCRPVDKLKSMEILSKLAGRLVEKQEIKHEFVLTPDQDKAATDFAKSL